MGLSHPGGMAQFADAIQKHRKREGLRQEPPGGGNVGFREIFTGKAIRPEWKGQTPQFRAPDRCRCDRRTDRYRK